MQHASGLRASQTHPRPSQNGKLLFGRDQFAAIAERLGRIKGRFILSINDVPEIRELFGRFDMIEVELNYTIATGKGVPAKELILQRARPSF